MTTKGTRSFRYLLLCLPLLLAHGLAQDQPAQSQAAPSGSGAIHGIVKSGTMPIPGAAVSITPASSGPAISFGQTSMAAILHAFRRTALIPCACKWSRLQIVHSRLWSMLPTRTSLRTLNLPSCRVRKKPVRSLDDRMDPPLLSAAFRHFLRCRTWQPRTQAATR